MRKAGTGSIKQIFIFVKQKAKIYILPQTSENAALRNYRPNLLDRTESEEVGGVVRLK